MQARLEAFREDLGMLKGFREEVSRRIHYSAWKPEVLLKECEEIRVKYPEYYNQFKVSIMAVRKLAGEKLRGAWEDVRADMLCNYHTYYEIREILTVDA